MRITFLGTGCGTRYPAVWCSCPHCSYARTHGGKNIRANCSALVDDDLLLDLNHETFCNAERMGIALQGVRSLLVTHPHDDHFAPAWLVWRRMTPGMDALPWEEQRTLFASRYTSLPTLHILGNAGVYDKLVANPEIYLDQPNQQLLFEKITPGTPVTLAGGTVVLPIRAQHGPHADFAVNYILMRDGKTILYALDTGGYDAETFELIRQYRYDLVIMEGTFGPAFERAGHMTLSKNIAMKRFFDENQLWAHTPRFYLSHLSPHWTPPHDEYCEMVAPEGLSVAYDGQVLEI